MNTDALTAAGYEYMAKGIVVAAFRNGPLEGLHAGKSCPTCHGDDEYSHITNEQMKVLMKYAVDHVYALLLLINEGGFVPGLDATDYIARTVSNFASQWDEPENTEEIITHIRAANRLGSL